MNNVVTHRSDESLEDYLETILMLEKKLSVVRSIDIVNELNLSKPSVSVAMKKLRSLNYITMNENNYIELTDEGRTRAETVLECHQVLTELLISLGVSEKTAKEDACKIEHDLSLESFEAIKSHRNKYTK